MLSGKSAATMHVPLKRYMIMNVIFSFALSFTYFEINI